MKSFLALLTIFCFLACMGSKNQINFSDAAGVVLESDSAQESDKQIDFPIITVSPFILNVPNTSSTPIVHHPVFNSEPFFQILTSEITTTGPPVA